MANNQRFDQDKFVGYEIPMKSNSLVLGHELKRVERHIIGFACKSYKKNKILFKSIGLEVEDLIVSLQCVYCTVHPRLLSSNSELSGKVSKDSYLRVNTTLISTYFSNWMMGFCKKSVLKQRNICTANTSLKSSKAGLVIAQPTSLESFTQEDGSPMEIFSYDEPSRLYNDPAIVILRKESEDNLYFQWNNLDTKEKLKELLGFIKNNENSSECELARAWVVDIFGILG